MNRDLKPVPDRKIRLAVVAVLWVLALSVQAGWLEKLVLLLLVLVLVGSWRQFRVSPKSIKHRWTVCFAGLPHRRWSLRRFTRVEVCYEEATTTMDLVLFGWMGFLYGWIISLCLPWIGGTYQIWLNDDHDNQRVLAWQGNSQEQFERNIEILQATTGLPLSMR